MPDLPASPNSPDSFSQRSGPVSSEDVSLNTSSSDNTAISSAKEDSGTDVFTGKPSMSRYNPKELEPAVQQKWDQQAVYKADLSSSKPKYVAMSMFNYPSGAGIHIGHAMNYTISDVKARFKRQQGYESFHPVGWDSFGLPAENFAIKSGVSPQQSMAKIIPDYHKQYKAMGWSNDWSKEIATHTPEYYKWTQWIFSQMYKNGLAYQDSRMQWWCEKCQTVLANEQVIDDKCWRHDGADDDIVEKKEVKQWFFKITDYADELLTTIDDLDWTESVKLAQKNWIGKSKGAEISFDIDGTDGKITVFTTRPDTLFGATFLVLAPEHHLVDELTTADNASDVKEYRAQAAKKTDVERQASKQKTGVFTGAMAINPINGAKLPVWVADYVLTGYGTGAIMAVPGHDERDYEFAQKFDIEIKEVVAPSFGDPLPDAVKVTGPVVIGYDPSTKRFMSLINNNNGVRWFASGGLEQGETYDQAALRELAEESGYRDVKKLIKLGGPTYSYYFNVNKQSNRCSFSYMYLAIISESENNQQAQESHENFKVEWSSVEQILSEFEKEPEGRGHWIAGVKRAKQAASDYDQNKEYVGPIYTEEGVLFDSGKYSGISSYEARERIVEDLQKQAKGVEKINYKMRDWSVSRQRYWGAPIPIIYCPDHGAVLVDDENLPVELPVLSDFQPSGDGRSALARASEWVEVQCPQCGKPGKRETDTLDTYICSSWYMLRYFNSGNTKVAFDPVVTNKWMPIDFYNGADHATAHMIYARFITRFFHKQGLLANPEPFKQFLFNGKVMAADGTMFSKSKGNGVDPLEIIEQGYGADALRTYLMFAAPLEFWAKWDPQGVPGTYRFLNRIWNIVQEYNLAEHTDVDPSTAKKVKLAVNTMVKKATEDIEANRYNTAISAIMACVNELYKLKEISFSKDDVWAGALTSVVACVAPFAPHIADELWVQLKAPGTVQKDSWPKIDTDALKAESTTVVVQINGKLRSSIVAESDATEQQIIALAKSDTKVREYLGTSEIKKTIYVKGRLVNFVV